MIEKITAYLTHISIHTGQIQLGSVLLLTGTNLKTFFFSITGRLAYFFVLHTAHTYFYISLCNLKHIRSLLTRSIYMIEI